ncbi:MAG TPA: glycosyltransferase family 4 protein [Terracidiphilus sp.]|jgi:glycosyltransferase involved in cell wall biosynthesis
MIEPSVQAVDTVYDRAHSWSGDDRPVIVVGITHSQTSLVLFGRLSALRRAGFRVVLISSPGRLLERIADAEGIEPIAVPISRGIAPLADFVSLVRLWRILGHLKPFATEFSTPKAGLLGSLAAKFRGVPVRIYILRGLRLETMKGLKRVVSLAAERIAAACSHHVVCNSESLREKARLLRVATGSKFHLLGSGSSRGVDVEHFSPGPDVVKARLGIPSHVPVIGFVGRLTRDKGVPELIQAFEDILFAIPSARLLFVGWFDDSEDAVDADVRATISNHPHIIHTGFVEDTAPYYKAMDILILPTWREGFPNVVLEAAATGIPVITTLSTGSRDAVVPEVTGLLIPAGYPKAISEAAIQLLRNPDRRYRMGRAARAWVLEHFANERVLALTVSFYRKLLSEAFEDGPVLPRDVPAAAD